MNNKSKLEKKKEFIAGALAVGVSQGEIARQVGVSQSSVSRFSNKAEVREEIERQTLSLLECLPDAVENVKSLVTGMKKLSPNETKRAELAFKASLRVLESSGLLNASTPSPVVANILIQNNSTYISPVVMKAIKMSLENVVTELPKYKKPISDDDTEDDTKQS